MSDMEYIRKMYDVPARVDCRVAMDGKPGTITGARGAHILVEFYDNPGISFPCHPEWSMEYNVNIPSPPRAKKRKIAAKERYRSYLAVAECYDSFRHFLACKTPCATIVSGRRSLEVNSE